MEGRRYLREMVPTSSGTPRSDCTCCKDIPGRKSAKVPVRKKAINDTQFDWVKKNEDRMEQDVKFVCLLFEKMLMKKERDIDAGS